MALDRVEQLVAAAVRAIAAPAERKPPARGGLTPHERSALSSFSDAECARIGAILDRLPAGEISRDPASPFVPAPGTARLDRAGPRKPLRARSVHGDSGPGRTSETPACPLRAAAQ